ncbi:MAG: ABC transporter ATP-binding protein, partial [Armatimonadetes bacterium]|nr:ABC transporter ATP-binding protein [Armatimonadota bacterium]
MSVSFGPRTVLRGVDLAIPAGQTVAMLGRNGAGKTTLLRAVLGLIPYAGTVSVGGRDVRTDGVRVRATIGYVPQVPAFPSGLCAAEVIAFFQRLRGLRADPLPLLACVGLHEDADRLPRHFSGGMLRRLSLAAALIGDPPVLLMDEPTANLDADGEADVLAWLAQFRREGRTVLLTSHALNGLAAVIDRVVLLREGRVALDAAAGVLLEGRHIRLDITSDPPRDFPLDGNLPPGAVVESADAARVCLRVPEAEVPAFFGSLNGTMGGRRVTIHEPSLEETLARALDARGEATTGEATTGDAATSTASTDAGAAEEQPC